MGLWSVQLTCRTALRRPVERGSKSSLYVDAEHLSVHVRSGAADVKTNLRQLAQEHLGKAEPGGNITCRHLSERRGARTRLAVGG